MNRREWNVFFPPASPRVMYLPPVYNRDCSGTRTRAALALTLLALVASGCESTTPRAAAPAPVQTVAPSSDVRRVRAFMDAEQVAAAGEDRASAVGRGESMAPIFGDTTMLVLTKLAYETLEPGMMVAYRNRHGRQVVHRLIARGHDDTWRVQGINNPEADPEPVTRYNYIGVVYASLVHEPEGASPASSRSSPGP